MKDRIIQDRVDGSWIVQIHLEPDEAMFVARAIRTASPTDSAAAQIERLAEAAAEKNECEEGWDW